MAETDYNNSNQFVMSSPSVVDDELGLVVPPWETMSTSQVLPPVLCAIFIAVVIVVIACCLIQKKSKSLGVLRQKSCHTIETLPETSDHDIYDVIDEIRGKRFYSDKFHRRHDKMETASMLSPHNLTHCDLHSVFTNIPPGLPFHCSTKCNFLTSKMSVRDSRDWLRGNREPASNDARVSTHTDGGISSVDNEDDGIYETLDRHWNFRNDLENAQSVDNKLVFENQIANCQDNIHEGCYRLNETPETSDVKVHAGENGCENGVFSNVCQVPDASSSGIKEARKLLCQISMYEITNEEDKPALIETTYYQVQSQISKLPGQNDNNIPNYLQSSSLRIIQEGMREKHPKTDLVLQPLKEEEAARHNLHESPVCKNTHNCATEKPGKIYERLHRSNSKRFPALIVKKSESFKTTSSNLNSAKEQHRIHRRKSDSSDLENPIVSARKKAKQAHIPAGREATRILTKLGPLPPVPVQRQVSHQSSSLKLKKDTSPLDASNSKVVSSQHCEPNLMSSTSGGFLSDEDELPLAPEPPSVIQTQSQEDTIRLTSDLPESVSLNGSSSQDVTDIEVLASHLRTLCDNPLEVHVVDEEDVVNLNLISAIETLSIDSGTISTGSECAVSMDSVCDNLPSDREGDGSNYYFVLEPRDGISNSSRNSDINEVSDCKERASAQNSDTH